MWIKSCLACGNLFNCAEITIVSAWNGIFRQAMLTVLHERVKDSATVALKCDETHEVKDLFTEYVK